MWTNPFALSFMLGGLGLQVRIIPGSFLWVSALWSLATIKIFNSALVTVRSISSVTAIRIVNLLGFGSAGGSAPAVASVPARRSGNEAFG